MKTAQVTTKNALILAKKQGVDEIVVTGSLAKKLDTVKKIATAGTAVIALITTALGAMPFTGGLSAFAAAPVAAMTGFEIAAIITAVSLGIGLIVALFRDYEEISFLNDKLVLRKKKRNKD